MFGFLYNDAEWVPPPQQPLINRYLVGDVEDFFNPVLTGAKCFNVFDDFEPEYSAFPQQAAFFWHNTAEEERSALFPVVIPPVVPVMDWTEVGADQLWVNVAYGLPLAAFAEDEDDDATYGWFLNPFIPPPPVICPNFPNTDPDATESFFADASGRPIAVLLCRICHSSLPLLVRGDFAIWCQTCCAFVSREDTVMATTLAPKFFRGVF